MEKLNYINVEKELWRRGDCIFTPLEFQRIFGISYFSSKNFINRHIKTGLFTKLRNGLYAFGNPSKFLVANKLYSPSYISFETALSYYHIIPDIIYTISSGTTRATREFEALHTIYTFHRLKKNFFFGYAPKNIDGVTVLMAEPEKAIVDYLYFVDLKKKRLNERFNISKTSKRIALKYTELFKRKSLSVLVNRAYDKPTRYT